MVNDTPSTGSRWLTALAAVAVHLSIGSVYAWSVYVGPLQASHGWSKPELTWAFSLCILVTGLAAAFGGTLVERIGPRRATTIAGVLFGLGVAGAALADILSSLPLLYASYGLLAGAGLGIAYIAPVSAILRWFPDIPGIAGGMVVFGFGAGALIAGPVAEWIIVSVGVAWAFAVPGAIYLVVVVIAAQALRFPPEGFSPAGRGGSAQPDRSHGMGLSTAVRAPRFWLVWLVLFINVSAGIMLISLASPMATDIAGMTPVQAAFMVGLMGIFNGAGRLFWSAASDFIGRAATFAVMFVVQIILFLVLAQTTSALLFQAEVFLIVTCYGGGFATCPAFTSDLFGPRRAGAIYGVILTAWSAAGVAGPQLGAYVRETTGSYGPALHTIVAALCVGLASAAAIWLIARRKRNVAAAAQG